MISGDHSGNSQYLFICRELLQLKFLPFLSVYVQHVVFGVTLLVYQYLSKLHYALFFSIYMTAFISSTLLMRIEPL